MVVVGGGSMQNLPFRGQATGVPSGKAFIKSTEAREGSEAGLSSRTPAHLRMAPRPCKTNPTALSVDTFPKRATADTRTSVPSTTRGPMDLLCETVPSLPGQEVSPVASLWLCDGTVRLLRPAPLLVKVQPLSLRVGSSCVWSLVHSACHPDSASRDSPGDPHAPPSTAS